MYAPVMLRTRRPRLPGRGGRVRGWRPGLPDRRGGPRTLLAGLVLLGAVGSCQLPKPQIPSIGSTLESPRAERGTFGSVGVVPTS